MKAKPKVHKECKHKWLVRPLKDPEYAENYIEGKEVHFTACCTKCLEKKYI
jgi:hypothetical protein